MEECNDLYLRHESLNTLERDASMSCLLLLLHLLPENSAVRKQRETDLNGDGPGLALVVAQHHRVQTLDSGDRQTLKTKC